MFTSEQKEKIKEYESLKLAEGELKTKIERLKDEIVPILETDKKIQLEYGVLSFTNRPDWIYSPKVKALEKDFKDAKAREQADGTAEKKDKFILEYRRDKEEGDE